VNRDALTSKLDWLLVASGHSVSGLPAETWAVALDAVERTLVHRAAIQVVRELVLPDWEITRKNDRRPHRALEAAEAWLASPSADAVGHAKACAKACTAARSETFGYEHRVAEAARACAWAVGARDAAHVFDALSSVEEELLSRIALTAEYHLASAQRRAIVEVLRRVLLPPIEPEAIAPPSAGPTEPVAYSTAGRFAIGQRLTHKKFGDVVVVGDGETWIEVQLADGSTKRLAQHA